MVQSIKIKLALSSLAILLLWLSFYPEDAEVYLFPRIIALSIAVLTLALWFVSEKETKKYNNFKVLAPGLLLIFLYISILEWLGFYTSSLLVFIVLITIYTKKPKNIWYIGLKELLIATAFIVVLYLLFALLLQVRTPTGLIV